MPPKKDGPAPEACIAGYDNKETRLLAAAFVSSIGPDKYDYTLFAKLSGFTEGTLKKFWPPVKKKVVEEHPNFGTFIGGGAAAAAPAFKATTGKKRNAADADADAELEPKASSADAVNSKASEGEAKKTPAKGKRSKKVKTEEAEDEEKVMEEENSADGGDGLVEA
ncbi:hypothetical protein BU25DRAFT_415906 [Macroventuria anomochaeta]|uniref:Uncharacterized protein n=1 Tax=Macroventuria anomochaeta TaxID=301207 RepID=A0ACB6RID7_9PLEO|nr:uncharacterized protein BU25DRAFT_415906 [Macroventuria anomochaeta]KAF2621710.1 hypothetical protein BU25DRAFT_415906 [Macroventuria anomochaeta]